MNYLRLGRDGLVAAGIALAIIMWAFYQANGSPVDAHVYWAADPANLYPHPELAEQNGYNYSPAFLFAIAWGRWLAFPIFIAIWRAILLSALVYMAGPFTFLALLWLPVASEINAGNIQILLALAIVLGFRYPGTWAFVLLTKVSPGVGLLWFAVRREWRPLMIVAIATGSIAVASMLVFPTQWPGYIALVTVGKSPSVWPWFLPLWLRLPPAAVITVVAGLTGKRWPVVVAATLALPVFFAISPSMLVGVLPFARQALGRLMADHGWSLERRTASPDPRY